MPDESQQLISDFGLTPKVEAAILAALKEQNTPKINSLILPMHPSDQAAILNRTSHLECGSLLRLIGEKLDPEAFTFLEEEVRKQAFEVLGPDIYGRLLPSLDSDDMANIAAELKPDDLANVLEAMPLENRVEVKQALSYPDATAGRMMQREKIVVPPFWDVNQTIDYVRSLSFDREDFYSVIITDYNHHPIGEVRFDKLIRASSTKKISEIMQTDLHLIPTMAGQEDVARLFRRYAMVSGCVVDEDGMLLGIITIDDVVQIIDEEADADLRALAGVSDLSLRLSIFKMFKGRSRWLLANLGTAILASMVIGIFDTTLNQLIALAILMPIVASMGGNAGTQTVTVAVRALALDGLTPKLFRRFLLKEVVVGFLNGIIFALLSAIMVMFWFADIYLAAVIAVAMIVNLSVASLSGVLIPFGLNKMGVDPAISSTVFLTTLTDITGFFVFLGLAALFLI
ncbi:magnesium transporter [Alphaproteobacteria bacterium]|jgi:magnesium transporter|nr:magnesium transporter [Alphaproteobacteria bacterium]MBT5799351.1 magnesium transporter [Alphaproteobacteria bacterium]MDC0394581.1 magnesium transporter [Alphaproteobacteria bacterium]MDC0461728.1 magnesium transporter [Alphaproteobacteria bacterium]